MDNELLTAAMREFSVIIEKVEVYNDTVSKARCRIFYKGPNRNGTFITDEFADKLCASLPYTPVKGIYDGDDFTDHGASRSLGRIYGIVMENPNLTWESHVDIDGVERTYACVDVLLFTALYKEAKDIVGKPQSMEIYAPSIKGEWQAIDGKKYFVFKEGCFLGLEVLGDSVEPCFEGASFFSLYQDLISVINECKELVNTFAKGGNEKMENTIFKLSDAAKESALWSLINSEVDEEGYRKACHGIVAVYDDYAIAVNYETQEYERVYYVKDAETDGVSITERKKCYIVDVSEEEYALLNALHAKQRTCCELQADYDKVVEENENYSQKNVELEETVSTLNQEKEAFTIQIEDIQKDVDTLTNSIEEYKVNIESLTSERDSLLTFKHDADTKAKQDIIDSYATLLSEEVLGTYTAKIDEYADAISLDKDLAYELKKSNISAFSHVGAPTLIPTGNVEPTGIEAILTKYKK